MIWVAMTVTLLGTGDNTVARVVPGGIYQTEEDCLAWVARRTSSDRPTDLASGLMVAGEFYTCMPMDSLEVGKTSAPKK